MSTSKKINLARLRQALKGDISPTGKTLGLLTGEVKPIPKSYEHDKGKGNKR